MPRSDANRYYTLTTFSVEPMVGGPRIWIESSLSQTKKTGHSDPTISSISEDGIGPGPRPGRLCSGAVYMVSCSLACLWPGFRFREGM